MTWPITMVLLFAWFTIWLCVAAKHTASREGPELLKSFSTLLPAFVVSTCLISFVLAPNRTSTVSILVLWIHHMSVLLLLGFLLAGQYFQIEAWWKIRSGRKRPSICETYGRLNILTTIVPAPIALTIFLTGLRLIWQIAPKPPEPLKSVMSAFWLQGLVVGFGLFFWDGILGYTPLVSDLWRRWNEDSVPKPPSVGESGQLLVHVLSWPFVFLLGVFRWDFATPLTPSIEAFEGRLGFLPIGWPEVVSAFGLWLLMGLVVGAVRVPQRFAASRSKHKS